MRKTCLLSTFRRVFGGLALAIGLLLAENSHATLSSGGVDLRPAFERWDLPPRVQGKRNTCSVFTVAGALEYALASKTGHATRLSVEFLNWASNQTARDTQDGSFFSDLWQGFTVYGACPEPDMPYQDKFDPEPAFGGPDEDAQVHARQLREVGLRLHWIKPWDPNTGLTDEQLVAINQVLNRAWPVCGGFRWPKKARWTSGVLDMAPPEGVFDGHSVLIVGYRDDPQQPGGGMFLFRNSNNNGRDGWMTYEYARAYMNDAAWIDHEKDDGVISPDGKNAIFVQSPGEGNRGSLAFAVARSGRTIIEPSVLKMSLAGSGSLTEGCELLSVQEDRLDDTFTLPWGKSRLVRNRCSLARLRLRSAGGILWDLEVRAYDDGVALRYGLPEQDALRDFVLEEEATEFRLAGDPSVLFTTVPNFTTPHETLYERKPYAELPGKTLIDMPLLVVWPGGLSAALTEARLRDFAGMYLERTAEAQSPVLHARLSPLPSRSGACVVGRTPHWSPWRVILLADTAGRHLESSLLLCLNDPPAGDFSWVRPGKTTWHWWNGTAEEGLPFQSGMNYETHKRYIDFCARHGITYHAVVADDRPWHQQSLVSFAPGPDTDILEPRPELEFPKILEYARQRGVGIRLWVHWRALNERLEEAFTRYEQWGIRGLMVDFLDRDDQEMIQFCERVLESAARHKLHIQFHGSYRPSGEQRTFPNLVNREGVLNLEYLKWSALCTPQHNVNVAYTRALAGPTDYHLGGFRSVSPEEFQPRNANPTVLGTRCHHLAMYIVYENPMPMICDSPSSYEGQTGFEFLEEVPTTWDESRFLAGEAGQFVIMARRKDTA